MIKKKDKDVDKEIAIIGGVGSGSGFNRALIEKLLEKKLYVVAIARSAVDKDDLIQAFANDRDVEFAWGDLNDTLFLKNLTDRLEKDIGAVSVYIHNPLKLALRPFLECTIEDFEDSWIGMVKTAVSASQILLPSMLQRKEGTLIFTGATASIKGNAKSSPFAVAKFGLRALSQSLAREFGPQGIHVAHVIADGIITGKRAQEKFNFPESKCINPEALADVYINLIEQDPSCWTQEMDLRPAHETF